MWVPADVVGLFSFNVGPFSWNVGRAPRSACTRVPLGSILGISVFVGLPGLLHWVNVRATAALAVSLSANLAAAAGGGRPRQCFGVADGERKTHVARELGVSRETVYQYLRAPA